MKRRAGWAVGWMLLSAAPGAAGERPAPIRSATEIVSVEAAARPDAVAVTIRGNGALSPTGIRRVDHFRPRLVMDFTGLSAAPAAATRVEIDPVDRVRVDRWSVESTRVVIELARAAPYRVEAGDPAGAALTLVFPRNRLETGVGGVPDARSGPPPGAAAGAPVAAAGLPGQPPGAEPGYTGDPVSMDFQNADLRAVLRVFAEISGLNIVVDSTAQGTVNVALTQVPWDQAFEVILRANGLGYEIDGAVVRIASLQRLQEEAEARAALARREAETGVLQVFTRTLSHARADDLVPMLTGASLSARGEVFTDPRTNTLIVRDLADRLPAIDELLDALDRSEPQVEIEARVVRAGHDSARALGVRWGLSARGGAPPRGEPGASGDEAPGRPDRRLTTGVDLGVGAPTSTLGVVTGAAGGPLDLDVTLSALESRGELRIISSPRVTTQNNVQAEILQGDQIPYQTVANNTVTVEFKEAALTLRVTPRITTADTVIMQVEVENSFADFARALGNPPIPSIVTQRAATTVHVGDGETAVIGGIYENTRSEQSSRTPGLHRIPVIGWFFSSTARNESTDELMIFLTPRIVRR